MPVQGRSLTGRLLEILRSWWPVAAFLVPVLVAQALWSGRYEVAGHAADHLQSATPVFPMIFLSAVLLWALPGRGRRDRLLWLLLAAAIASCLVVLVGNVQVIEAIDGATWTDAQASQLGPARPGFASGHDLAQLGAWGAVLATMLAAGLLWQRRFGVGQGRRGGGRGQSPGPLVHCAGRRHRRPGGLGRLGTRTRRSPARKEHGQSQPIALGWRRNQTSDLILIRKSTVSRHAAVSGRSPDPISVVPVAR